MKRRKYTLRKRAEDKQATRERIVEAAMALHGEVGPRDTTISAIAERAGVQRLTVYRHFADENELFRACSSTWLERNPPPAPESWRGRADARETTRAALLAFYRYYSRTEAMWQRVYRDAEHAALQVPLAEFHELLASVRDELAAGWRPSGRKPKALEATIAHALEFSTWQSLSRHGLAETRAARVATGWIEAAGER